MKKILLSVLLIGSSLFGEVGEAGSKRESFQLKIKVELIKEDNTRVTILDGTNFIELKTKETQTGLAAELEAVRPDNGIYIGAKYTVTQFKHMLKIVDSQDITYYTVNKEVPLGNSWGLSTNVNDYGHTTTVVPGEGFSTTVMFPKVLTLKDGSDASLIWVNQYLPNSLRYELDGATSIMDIKWADEATKVTAFLPAEPSKTIVFDVIYTKSGADNLTNTITALLDTDGDLIGAYQMRPSTNSALNGSFLIQGTKTDNAYLFRFQNGDDSGDGTDGDDYFDVEVTLNCLNSSYSNLIITEVKDGGAAVTAKPSRPDGDGYSLTESGTVACTDLNL